MTDTQSQPPTYTRMSHIDNSYNGDYNRQRAPKFKELQP